MWLEVTNSPPLNQNSILGKKGGGQPHFRQKFNQLRFGSNFQSNLSFHILLLKLLLRLKTQHCLCTFWFNRKNMVGGYTVPPSTSVSVKKDEKRKKSRQFLSNIKVGEFSVQLWAALVLDTHKGPFINFVMKLVRGVIQIIHLDHKGEVWAVHEKITHLAKQKFWAALEIFYFKNWFYQWHMH